LKIVAVGYVNGLRGWDRTNLNTAASLWSYTASGDISGLASKSTTNWFLGGRQDAAEFIKFHFEVVDIVQLTYTTSNTDNRGLTWYINTAYIMQSSYNAAIC
jgi:hypothetical protein